MLHQASTVLRQGTSNRESAGARRRASRVVLGMAIGMVVTQLSPLGVRTAHADSTWAGTNSQDWNDGNNWSPAGPSGNFFVNMATGNYPVLTADSGQTPVDLVLGGGGTNSGRFDQRSGTVNLANTGTNGNWMFVGRGASTASGVYNLADTSVVGAGITGFGQGSGNLNVGKLWIGGSAFFNGGTGTVNINTSGTITANSTADFGYTLAGISLGYGTLTSSGVMNLENGTVQCNSEMFVGFSGNGVVNQTGGSLNTTRAIIVGFFGAGTYNLSGGTANVASILMSAGTSGSGTVNLDGGAIVTGSISGGANSYFNFNGGTLKPVASNASFMTSGVTFNVRNAGAIIDTNGFDVTVSRPLSHSNIAGDNATDGGLTKNGAGALTLSGANTYTGPTNINAGTLAVGVGGSIASSQVVNLNSGALDGRGSVAGLKVTDSPSNIVTNAAGATLTAGTLTFQGDAVANVNVTASTPLVAGVSVTGALSTQTVDATGVVTLNATSDTGLWSNGFNNLISYGTKNFDLSDFTLVLNGTLGPRQVNGGLVLNGNNIAVNIVGDTIYWTGGGNNAWATGLSNNNWKKTSDNSNTNYLEGDTISFLDGASNTAINLTSNVNPGNMTFNNSATTYSISSSGGFGIGGIGVLTKAGTSTLTISTVNTYTGGTNINAGTVLMSGSGNLGTGTVTVGGGVWNLGGTSQTAGAVKVTAAPAAGDAIMNGTLSPTSLSVSNTSGVVTISATLNGTTSVTKTGAGTLTLTAANNYSGTTTVNGGTLNITNATTGGVLNVGGEGGAGAMNVGPGVSASWSGVSNVGYRTGAGTLNITGGTFTTNDDLRVGGSDLNGPQYNGTGTVNISGGVVTPGALTVARGNWVDNAISGTVNLSGGTLAPVNDVILGFAGTGTGRMSVGGTGVFNVGSGATKWFMLGTWDTSKGVLDVNAGGKVNLMNNSSIKFNRQNTTGPNVINHNGGEITFYSDAGTTPGGGGNLDMQLNGGATSLNTYNLNGGTLTVTQVLSSNTSGTRVFNFNGGVLKPTGSNTNFLNLGAGSATVNVRNGGAIIDTSGFDVTVASRLLHSNVGGDAAIDGGLTKRGAGVLTLSGATSTYTGVTKIAAGTVRLPSAGAPVAVGNYTFDNIRDTGNSPVTSGSLGDGYTVVNDGSGGAAMNGSVNNAENLLGPGTPGGTVVAGRFGNGVSFDGLGSSVDIASQVVNQSSGTGSTMSLWINTNSPGGVFVGKNNGGVSWNGGNAAFYLGAAPSGGSRPPGEFPTAVRNGGGFERADTDVVDNTWHMLTFVDTGAGKQIYVDGVLLTLTETAFNGADTSTVVRLARNIDSFPQADGTTDYAGVMDELKFYNAALSAQQVAELFASNSVTTGFASVQYLPTTTAVDIDGGGATLDLASNDQVIGSLNGQAGSSVTLGTGNLTTGGDNTSTTFAGVISGSGGITKTGTGVMILSGANTYTGSTNVNAGELRVATSGNISTGAANVSGGTLTLSAGRSGATKVASLSLTGSGSMDVNDNDLVVGSATAKSAIEGYVTAARNGGNWNGTGLTSTSARNNANHTTGLGVLSGAEYNSVGGTGVFGGQSYSATDTLVKYTWNGDANFDGRITFDDYVKIDTGFNTGLTGWLNGDFNYSGAVNFDDYVLIDIAFNQQNGTLGRAVDWISGDDRSAAGLSGDAIETMLGHMDQFGSAYGAAFLAAVPEPSALVALGVPALAGMFRRHRRA